MSHAETTDPHHDLHSEQGSLPREHPGRSDNPVVKVTGLAWLEFQKPDLDSAAAFAADFGLTVHQRTPDAIYLRGTWEGAPCIVVRRGPVSRFIGPTFSAGEAADLDRLAKAADAAIEPVDEVIGGRAVSLRDPSGIPVRVVYGATDLAALPDQIRLTYNMGPQVERINSTQRPVPEPARVQRLGHLVLMTTRFRTDLDWYLDTFGLIVSDFLFIEGQRERGPSMGFIRCDLGSQPSDHHTMAMTIGPEPGYVHSAYQVNDLDALAVGGQYLADAGYTRAWGIGRHILGSQVFDYWRDPDRLMMEHYTDGDVFDSSLETGWSPMSAQNLYQWGPPVTNDFLGIGASPRLAKLALKALREDNEIDMSRLLGLMKAMKP